MVKILLFALLVVTQGSLVPVKKPVRSIASVRHALRVEHAKELLGTHYRKSIVSKFEGRRVVAADILSVVRERLPKKDKAKAGLISRTIMKEARRHALDPYFVMAVVAGESSFNPRAQGPVGEIGLMQIRPSTGEWMAKKMRLKWKGGAGLYDPVLNIRIGTAYLAWLREEFKGHGQLYVAAYNMGARSVRNAVDKNVWPKDYPTHVMKRYISFYREMGIKI